MLTTVVRLAGELAINYQETWRHRKGGCNSLIAAIIWTNIYIYIHISYIINSKEES